MIKASKTNSFFDGVMDQNSGNFTLSIRDNSGFSKKSRIERGLIMLVNRDRLSSCGSAEHQESRFVIHDVQYYRICTETSRTARRRPPPVLSPRPILTLN